MEKALMQAVQSGTRIMSRQCRGPAKVEAFMCFRDGENQEVFDAPQVALKGQSFERMFIKKAKSQE
jgi:hypothetical protein